MTYRVDVAPAAVRQLRKFAPPARRRIQAAIELLAEQPRPSGATKLVGGEGEWRVRTGDYRIVYEIHVSVLLVLVVADGHRRDIYDRTDQSARIWCRVEGRPQLPMSGRRGLVARRLRGPGIRGV